MSEHCLFCRVASEPSRPFFVLENDRLIAMPALHPVNPGHLVVVPRQHVESMDALAEGLAEELLRQAAALGRLLVSELDYTGYTLILHAGAPGQPLPHLHLNVIPRREGDPLDLTKPDEAPRWDLALLASRLRERLVEPRA